MSVYPEYLTSISGEWIEPYVWVFTLGDFEVYNRSDLPTGYEICVNINPSSPDYNTWFDYGDQKPHIIQDDGTTVRLRSNNVSNFFTFTKPTVASWIPVTNPATGTEGDGGNNVDDDPPPVNESTVPTLTYDPVENLLHYFIPSAEFTTILLPANSGGRELFYRVRLINQAVVNINHTYSYDTNGSFRPTTFGIYHLERVFTNPFVVESYDYAEVTNSQLIAWNLLQPADDPPADDPPADDPPVPPNTPRSRRGNLNFW